ncbi:ACP S-malonyltransferase [Streptosporangium sp. NPDC000396]|uniref:ACP S-malonyltransferase n=1 Tax=Streptosporangium sp. NPDC000396 TaxID=3366185 RepID=UPI0036CF51F5
MTDHTFGIAFPGQGVKREALVAGLNAHRAHPLVSRLFATFGALETDDLDLDDTAVTQPTTFALGIAAVETFIGSVPDVPLVLGHSLGELTAAVCSGALDVESGFQLALKRGRLCRDQNSQRPGAMVAVVGTELDDVEWLRRRALAEETGILEIAGINSRRQAVLSGDAVLVAKAVKLADDDCLRTEMLPISGAFHSPLMLNAIPEWRRAVESAEFRQARTPFISSIDARVHTDPDEIREMLVRALLMPVRWRDSVRKAAETGVPGLLDAGPGDTLLKLARRDRILTFDELAGSPLAGTV